MDDVHVYAISHYRVSPHKMTKTFASNRIEGTKGSDRINPIWAISNQQQRTNKKKTPNHLHTVKDLWTKYIICMLYS